MKDLRSRLICSWILIFLTSVMISCGKGKKAVVLEEVSIVPVERKSIDRTVMFTGNILAEDAFDIYPRAAGKVLKKLLKEGDEVKRNQAILTVERDEVGYSFKPMPIVSLVDGIVGSIRVDVGSYVEPDKPVATVVHPGKMRVKIDVPERYLNAISPGAEVSLDVDYLNGEVFKGTIATASPFVDTKTRTAKVEITIPDSFGKLRHGMFARLNLPVETHDNALTVPNDSVSWEGAKQFVYIYNDKKVERREVKTGIRNDVKIEILDGLSEGEMVVVGNLLELKDGEAVKIKE